MSSATTLFTAEDLVRIQRETGDSYELIEGKLRKIRKTTWYHERISLRIGSLFDRWNEVADAGEVGVEGGFRLRRDPESVLAADVAFTRKGRIDQDAARRGFPDLAPDLAVEVRSPSAAWSELVEKAERFLAAGSLAVLLVEPDQFVELHRLGQQPQRFALDDTFTCEDVLPGFSCQVRQMFPGLP